MGELLREFVHEITARPTRFAAEVVQSLLLMAILWRYAGTAVRRRLAARRERIVAELTDADRAEEEANRLSEEARARVARAGEEAPALLRQAQVDAQQLRGDALRRIEAEAAEVVGQARQAVEQDKARVARQTAGRLVQLTAQATSRYLDEMLTESDRRALTQQAIAESLAALSESPPTRAGAS